MLRDRSFVTSCFKIDGHGVPKWHAPTVVGAPKFYEGSPKSNIWNKCLMTQEIPSPEPPHMQTLSGRHSIFALSSSLFIFDR